MPNTQYLEFDSTYRDRNLYPIPSQFVVEISQSGLKSKETALSPICDSSPVLIWNNSFDESKFATSITLDTSKINPITSPSLNGNTTFQISTTGGLLLRQVRNYYLGATFVIEANTGSTKILRRIVDYLPLNSTNAIISLDSSIPDTITTISSAGIYSPSPLATNTASAVIKVFIPGSNDCRILTQQTQTYGTGGENYYVGYYIQNNDSPTDYKLITAFDSTTRLATLEGATATDWNAGCINLVIRKELPTVQRTAVQNSAPSTINIYLNGATSSTVNNYYVGDYLRIVPPVATAGTAYAYPYAEERRIIAYSFTGASTALATVDPPFTLPVVGGGSPMYYEIEKFSRDGVNPFIYTGSMVSVQEMVCYEVELLNIVIPNTILKSGRGGRAIFYPYFYTELEQVSSPSAGNKGTLYTNNPNGTHTLTFRTLSTDTTMPVVSPFIRIDGDSMVHTVKFKPNDSFKFSLKHADGELVQTVIDDTDCPTEPNPLAQVSACFAFRRI
jgi:hypothetical protein